MIFDSKITPRFFKAIFGKTGKDKYQAAKLDPYSHALESISHSHAEVHEGNYYRSGMNFTLANAEVATFGLTTPDSKKWIHITWSLSTSADGVFDLLEDVTSFAGGASCIPLNHNRNSKSCSDAVCVKGMTGADLVVPTGGTTILSAILTTGKGVVVDRGVTEEFILKQNSNYLFRYTNGTSANVIRLFIEGYEEESAGA